MSATTARTVTRDPRNWVLLGAAVIALTLAVSLLPSRASVTSWAGSTSNAQQTEIETVAATSEAIRFWELRAARDPLDFIANNKLADLYLRRAQQIGDIADYERAEQVLHASLAAFPQNNRVAETLLPHVYNIKHEFTKSLPLATTAVATYPREPFAWGVLGDAQLALGDYDGAERSYGRMLGFGPSLGAFTRTAHMAEVRGDLKRATLDWTNALSVDDAEVPETRAWARAEFGRFQFSRGDLDGAEKAFRDSLTIYPNNVAAIAGLASVFAARGNEKEAITRYQQVVGRNPLPEYVIGLGDIYARNGMRPEANRQYALVRAIGQLYEANGIRSDLTLILFEADHGGDPAAVLTRAEAAYRERRSLWAADAYGWALYRAGRYTEARERAEEALSLGTSDALMSFHAGMIAAKQGDTAAAVRHLTRAIEINPHFHMGHAAEAKATLRTLGGGS